MVKPHTQHRGEQQLTWKKHLPAPGKPPQTSAGKHRRCESSRRFGCSPVPSFSSAHHLTGPAASIQLPVGSQTAPPGPAWCKRSAGSREPGTDTPQGQTLLLWCLPRRSSTAGSGIPGSALLCVPAATWVWDCQQTLPATLTSNLCWVGVYMATFQPCRQQEPLPCVTSQTQRGWVVLGGWERDLPWPGLPHSVKFLNFSVFPLHKI